MSSTNSRRMLALLIATMSFVVVSAVAWRATAFQVTAPAAFYILLGSGLLAIGAYSTYALALNRELSRAARYLLLLGPVIGCFAGGLGAIVMATLPGSGAAIYLFVVNIVAFQAAAVVAIFVAIGRGKALRERLGIERVTPPAP